MIYHAINLSALPPQNSGLLLRLEDMQKSLERERADFCLRLKQKDEDLAAMRIQLENLEVEYAALLEIKVKLDREIEAYRKLLESEETR